MKTELDFHAVLLLLLITITKTETALYVFWRRWKRQVQPTETRQKFHVPFYHKDKACQFLLLLYCVIHIRSNVKQVWLALPTGCTWMVPAIELTARSCRGLMQKNSVRKIKEHYSASILKENSALFTKAWRLIKLYGSAWSKIVVCRVSVGRRERSSLIRTGLAGREAYLGTRTVARWQTIVYFVVNGTTNPAPQNNHTSVKKVKLNSVITWCRQYLTYLVTTRTISRVPILVAVPLVWSVSNLERRSPGAKRQTVRSLWEFNLSRLFRS